MIVSKSFVYFTVNYKLATVELCLCTELLFVLLEIRFKFIFKIVTVSLVGAATGVK